jgi:hypothetical protein
MFPEHRKHQPYQAKMDHRFCHYGSVHQGHCWHWVRLLVFAIVVKTVQTVKNILDHWRIESIILFLYVDLEKPMIASIAHVSDVIGML